MLFQSALERTISGKSHSDVECYWLLLVTVMSEMRIVQFRKSGKLPDPAELSGSNSAVFTHEQLC